MSIQIKYKNELNSFVSIQQVQGLKEYSKLTYDNNQLQQIETFIPIRNGNKKTVEYFLSDGQVKESIIQGIINAVISDDKITKFSLVIYFSKQIQHGFTSWDWEEYSVDKVLLSKGKSTYDAKNRLVFYCFFDLQTNALKKGAFKFYYGGKFDDENDDLLLKFNYYDNGEVELVTDYNDFLGLHEAIYLDEFLYYENEFKWEDHPYYHSAYTILPNSPTV
jgi:hypothetical protein